METPLARAIKAAGGVTKLAAALGITSQAISQWEMVPLERVLAVEAATGIDRTDLRPDVFNAPRPCDTEAPEAAA